MNARSRRQAREKIFRKGLVAGTIASMGTGALLAATAGDKEGSWRVATACPGDSIPDYPTGNLDQSRLISQTPLHTVKMPISCLDVQTKEHSAPKDVAILKHGESNPNPTLYSVMQIDYQAAKEFKPNISRTQSFEPGSDANNVTIVMTGVRHVVSNTAQIKYAQQAHSF